MELPGAAVQTIGQSTAASTEQVSCSRYTQEKLRENFEGKTFWRAYQNSEVFYLTFG